MRSLFFFVVIPVHFFVVKPVFPPPFCVYILFFLGCFMHTKGSSSFFFFFSVFVLLFFGVVCLVRIATFFVM